MRCCVTCMGYLDDGADRCPADGSPTWAVGGFSPAFGHRFGADHVVVEEIARGGMAVVYRAVQVSAGREEALKVLPAHAADDGREAARFLRSAELARRLRHPRSVRVHDFGQEDDGSCWLAMELLRGRTLHEALQAGGAPMEPRRACAIATQVLEALEEAHGLGLVHRDVKPENVFLVDGAPESEAVRLLDFGLARASGVLAGKRLTLDGTTLGTPAYMSPEQGHGRDLDPRSDLYSVGVLLFEMLSGQVPHADVSALRVLLKKVGGPAPRIGDLAPDARVPPALEALVAALLEIDPGRRPSGAREVIARLEESCPPGRPAARGPGRARQESTFRKITRPMRALPATRDATPKAPVPAAPAGPPPQGPAPARRSPVSSGRRAPARPAEVPGPARTLRLGEPARPASLRVVRYTAALDTGISSLDDQHRDLFDLADAALGGPGPGTSPESVRKALELLVEYAHRHFRDEEEHMARAGFPARERHRVEHRAFAEAFSRLEAAARRGDPIDGTRGQLRLQMSLLVRHVRTSDLDFARFVRGAGGKRGRGGD